MGRRSYEVYVATGGGEGPVLPVYVYSRTLPEGTRDGVTVARDAVTHVRALKQADGKPLWLWGGGELFASSPRPASWTAWTWPYSYAPRQRDSVDARAVHGCRSGLPPQRHYQRPGRSSSSTTCGRRESGTAERGAPGCAP